jgi:hypothetical protein
MMPPRPAPADPTTSADTAAYITLARAVAKMRRQQAAYFKLRRAQPHMAHAAELNAARDAERAVDDLVRDALERERVELPGFTAEGGAA